MKSFLKCKNCSKVHESKVISCSLCKKRDDYVDVNAQNTATIRAILGDCTYTNIPVEVLNRSLADGAIENTFRGISND